MPPKPIPDDSKSAPPVTPVAKKNQGSSPAAAADVFQCCTGSGGNHHHPGVSGLDVHRKGSAWSITNMPPEIAEYAIDRPVNFDTKADDMKRHLNDETLDLFQRAILCLQSTESAQKVFAAQNIFSLIQQDEKRAFQDIIPAIEAELKRNTDPEFHEAASISTVKAINELLKKNPARGKQLLHMGATFAASGVSDISEAWSKCFDTLVDLLGSADLQREIVPQITERFGVETSTVNAKRVAANLISKLTLKSRLPEEVVAKRLVPVVETLCRDSDPTVKRTMCAFIPDVIVKLKNKEKMFALLNNFAGDNDPSLLASLTGALGKTATLINPKDPQANDFFQIAIPCLKKLVKNAYVDGNANILIEFTKHMGQMASIFSGAGVLSPGDKLWFLDAYLQLSRYGLPPTLHKKGNIPDMPTGFMNFRANMEFNKRHSLIETLISSGTPKSAEGPGMSPAATLALLRGNNNVTANKTPPGHHRGASRLSAAAEQEDGWICRANASKGFFFFLKFAKPLVDFRNGLHPMIVDLMHDPIPAVRAKMAENLFAMMEYLGVEGALLNGEVVYSLSDDSISVIEAIMPQLANIMKIFVQAKLISPDLMTSSMVELGGALLFCEERLSQTNDWRLHALMLEQFAVLPFCLPGDYVYNNFVPALFHRLLHMRQLPCRIAAADVIVTFLRHCRRTDQREEIRKKINKGFAQGNSVHDRMLFMFMSKKIMDMFSRKYYRDHFFETTLSLADDTVPNIRLKAVNMMPDLKGVLQMSEEPSLLKKLDETLKRIKNSETDRDVQNAIEAVIPEMAKIGVVFKNEKKGPKTKEDLEDEAKEREEAFIAGLEPVGGKATSKDKTNSMYKTSRRHTDPSKAVVSVPAQPKPTPLPPASIKPELIPPTVQLKLPEIAVKAVVSADTTKLALQMKGHTFAKTVATEPPKISGPSRKSVTKEEKNKTLPEPKNKLLPGPTRTSLNKDDPKKNMSESAKSLGRAATANKEDPKKKSVGTLMGGPVKRK